MDRDQASQPRKTNASIFWRFRYGLGLLVFGAAATYFLITEHRALFIDALPFLVLLACALMHVFMHHGHGGHGHRTSGDKASITSNTSTATALLQAADSAGLVRLFWVRVDRLAMKTRKAEFSIF